MPRVAKIKCQCGCEQAPAATTRQKLCECANGHKSRMSREVIALGFSHCACGFPFVPVCLFDRAELPGDDGRDARADLEDKFTGQRVPDGFKGAWESYSFACPDCPRFRSAGSTRCDGCGSISKAIPLRDKGRSERQKRTSKRVASKRRAARVHIPF